MDRGRSPWTWVTLASALLSTVPMAACNRGGTVPDAPDGGVLECDAPIIALLEPSVDPANFGLPIAGIAWTEGRCAILADETHPDVVLVIADTAGTFFDSGLVAVRAGGWVIAESSLGTGPTTDLRALPTSTDITVELERDDDRLSIAFRIVGRTLTLLSMERR